MGLEIEIIPILPKPKDWPANLIPQMDRAIETALRGPVASTLKREFKKRVHGWREPPYFAHKYTRESSDRFSVYVFPSGNKKLVDRYRWVSRGTNRKGRFVEARRPGGVMRFRSNYTPHTKPGNKYGLSGGGSRAGDIVVAKRLPMSSIEPRKFEEHILDDVEKVLVDTVNKYVRRVT